MAATKCSLCGVPMPEPGIEDQLPVCRECQQWQASGDARWRLVAGQRPERLPGEISRGQFSAPTRLEPRHYYLICDHHHVVARWENDGRSWMLRIRDGFVRARHAADEIPWFGQFVLIDIGVEQSDQGTELTYVRAYQLQEEFALTRLVKSDDAILGSVTGPAVLDERQKEVVREFVKSRYLRPVWHTLDGLLEST